VIPPFVGVPNDGEEHREEKPHHYEPEERSWVALAVAAQDAIDPEGNLPQGVELAAFHLHFAVVEISGAAVVALALVILLEMAIESLDFR